MLKDAERMQVEVERAEREVGELTRENIPQAEKELEDRKDKRRDMENELKALREGKDNSVSQATTL